MNEANVKRGQSIFSGGKAYSLASLKRKKLLSRTPLKLALNSFIFALKDSAAAFVDLLI